MSTKETPANVIFLNCIEPLIERESYRQFQLKEIEAGKASLKKKVYGEVIKLRDLEKTVVLLFFWEDMSLEQISRKINLKKESVKKLLEIALKNIKTSLSKDKNNLFLRKELAQE